VWPPAPDASNTMHEDDDYLSQLPDQMIQNRLLDIYFRHIHSSFPVLHKRSFLSVYEKTWVSDSRCIHDARLTFCSIFLQPLVFIRI
jgi:hypothetical protein